MVAPTNIYCAVYYLLPRSLKNQFALSSRFTHQPPRIVFIYVGTEFATCSEAMEAEPISYDVQRLSYLCYLRRSALPDFTTASMGRFIITCATSILVNIIPSNILC